MKVFLVGALLVGLVSKVQSQNSGINSAIAAGSNNTIPAGVYHSFIGAGVRNTNGANSSFLGAGVNNQILSTSVRSGIVAGLGNYIGTNSPASFMGAGSTNTIYPNCPGSVIAGGDQNTIYNGGFVLRSNSVIVGGYKNFLGESFYSSIMGGWHNTNRNSDYTFIGGGAHNSITNDCAFSSIGVGFGLRLVDGSSYSSIGSGQYNQISNNSTYSRIGGGFNNWIINGSSASVISGGQDNTINVSDFGTVSGGRLNAVTVSNGTVGGGFTNTVQGTNGTVSGGASNTVSGSFGTIPGGSENTASGSWTIAMGYRANAIHFGSMVIGLGPVAVNSTTNSQFTVLAVGGTRIFSSAGGAGAVLSANATAWGVLSDRNSKENFRPIQPKLVLAKLAQMPVTEWNYRHDPGRRYIGPTSQDFQASFGLGSDTTISTLDADGVTFAAIQGLVEELQERDRTMAWEKLQSASALAERDGEIASLKREMKELKAAVESLLPPAK